MIELAHALTYRWPEEFPGFQADLDFQDDDATHSGTLAVALRPGKPPKMEVELDGGDVQWVTRLLLRMVTHRQDAPFDKRLKPVDERGQHPMGRLYRADDRFDTLFRVRGDWITEVTRRLPDSVNRVYHLSRQRAADGRYLPAQLASTRSDPGSGVITRLELIDDSYAETGGVMLPESRSVISQTAQGVNTRVVRITNRKVAP